MASRLILSLKKAGSQRAELWSLPIIDLNPVNLTGDGDARFAPRILGELHETSETSSTSNQEGMELKPVLRLPRNRGSLQLR